MGMSPQSGLPHNNRVGDFDAVRPAGADASDRQDRWRKCSTILANQSGLLGLSGVSSDLRDIEAGGRRRQRAGAAGPRRLRRPACGITWAPTWSSWAGPTRSSSPAASARTASTIRDGRLRGPGRVGHRARSGGQRSRPAAKSRFSAAGSRVQIWVMPTNEEIWSWPGRRKQLLESGK